MTTVITHRPRFYCKQDNQVATASSLADLLSKLKKKPAFNRAYIENYLLNGLFHRQEKSNDTLYEGIYSIPNISQDKLVEVENNLSLSEAVEQLTVFLLRSVKDCLAKANRVGLELSGGLDSSAIAALTRHCYPEKTLMAFTNAAAITTDSRYAFDESFYSQQVAKHLNLQPIVIKDGFDFHTILEKYTELLGTFSEVLFPVFHHRCFEIAQSLGISDLLSGFGGDEMVSQHATQRLQELRADKAYLAFYYEVIRSKKPQDWLKPQFGVF